MWERLRRELPVLPYISGALGYFLCISYTHTLFEKDL